MSAPVLFAEMVGPWRIEYSANGRQTGALRVIPADGGMPVHIDTLNITADKARTAFAETTCGKVPDGAPAIERADLLGALTHVASRVMEFRATAPAENGAVTDIHGRALAFEDPEPCAAAVDGATLLDDVVQLVARYVVLPLGAAVAIALWVAFTWVHEAFDISPILSVRSPERRCGKTTLIGILARLVRRNLPLSNATAAAIFRAIDEFGPTILADEADTFFKNNEELRGIFNSGHTRDAAYVLRVEGDDHEVRCFSTWAPKCLAGIGATPGTIADRAIIIPLTRKMPGEVREKARRRRLNAECAEFPARFAKWAAEIGPALAGADPDVPETALGDRAADNWAVLFSIADAVGGHWPERARKALAHLSGEDAGGGDSSDGNELLVDFAALFDERRTDKIATADVLGFLAEQEHRRWGDYRNGRAITANGVAALLRPYGVRPYVQRVGMTTFRGYRRADFANAFARFLPPDVTGVTYKSCNILDATQDVTQLAPVTGAKSCNVKQNDDVTPVTGQSPPASISAKRYPCARCGRGSYSEPRQCWDCKQQAVDSEQREREAGA